MSGAGCLIILTVIFGFIVISQLPNAPTVPEDHDSRGQTVMQEANATSVLTESVNGIDVTPNVEHSNWIYDESQDRMRGQTTYSASIRSENTVNFGFPYSGAQHMTIQLRKSPAHGNDVIFYIEQGQIMCDVYECIGTISFNGNTEQLTLVRSADNNSTVGFARYPEAIARKAKNADEIVVELTFYQEGSRQFLFNTKNLQWEHF